SAVQYVTGGQLVEGDVAPRRRPQEQRYADDECDGRERSRHPNRPPRHPGGNGHGGGQTKGERAGPCCQNTTSNDQEPVSHAREWMARSETSTARLEPRPGGAELPSQDSSAPYRSRLQSSAFEFVVFVSEGATRLFSRYNRSARILLTHTSTRHE